jgi:DNA-binding NtrC family response regulator
MLDAGRRCLAGTAATPEELWSTLSQDEWDVLILDLRLPEQTKLASVRMLHERYPDLPILVLSLNLVVPLAVGKRWARADFSPRQSSALSWLRR